MRKTSLKRMSALIFCLLLLGGAVSVQAAENIKPSTKEYEVTIEDANKVFIGNEKKVEWTVGKKYFLTYTVSKLEHNETSQSGVIVTTDNTSSYPYLNGGMQYNNTKSLLCEEGWTYFFRFEVTEKGFKTIVSKAKGEESAYIRLPDAYGDLTTSASYFGVWFAETGNVSANLTHVRCYDENGNNLGVYGKKDEGVVVIDTTGMETNTAVKHSYSFSVSEANYLAFGNLRPTSSDTIYLEYTVSNIKAGNVTQSGATMTNQPTETFPHGDDGYLKYTVYQEANEERQLLAEKASYLFRFERKADTFDIMVKRTLNGVDTYYSFKHTWGTYNDKFGYVTTWFGEECLLTADFTNVKCYDAAGNNLAIQTNKNVAVKHYGPLEDYSECDAVYYCKANDTFITLDDECNASKRVDGDGYAKMGTYSIQQAVMVLEIGDDMEVFDYTYNAFTDANDNTYVRLKESTVTFKTKVIGGEKIATTQTTAENGYKVSKPGNPDDEGRTFVRWETGDGKEYDFDEVVLKNMELYAVWEGDGEYVPTAVWAEDTSAGIFVATVICVVLAVGTTIGIIVISKEKKNGKSK